VVSAGMCRRKQLAMVKLGKYSRSFGFGGLLCSGLAGLLFLLYRNSFPAQSAMESVMLAGAFLGAAGQRLASALIIKPLGYYARLMQLQLLQRQIDEQTQSYIKRELTIKYFLGEDKPLQLPDYSATGSAAMAPEPATSPQGKNYIVS
jgi:hypothetical protein